MEAEELRIGNLVFDALTKTECTVDALSLNGDIFTEDHKYDDWERRINPEPIQLTPEWLEKFGFQIDPDGWFALGGNFGLDPQEDGTFRPHLLEDTCTKYVHQLQNLYYALTGKELELIEVKNQQEKI